MTMCNQMAFMEPSENLGISRVFGWAKKALAVLILIAAILSVLFVGMAMGYEAGIKDYRQHLRANDYVCPISRPYLTEPTALEPEPKY